VGSAWRSAVAGVATLGLLLMAPPAFAAEPEGFGNNLAMPVIWAEDTIGPTLRGTGPQEASLGGSPVSVDGATVFLQQEELNEWQAENLALTESGLPVTAEGKIPVTFVDWGDNLEVKDWSTKQKIRVETRLLQNVGGLVDPDPADPQSPNGMTGYSMLKYGDETGPDEMWGVVAEQEGSTWVATENQVDEAFVYTGEACLTIERVDDADTVSWDPTSRTWTGAYALNTCLGDVEGGLNGLGAEVTISGGMTYGSVWDPGGLPDGQYRMTFSLQEGSKVDITEDSVLYASAEEGEEPAEATLLAEEAEGGSGGAPEGNTAVLVPELDLTYIDVGLSFVHGKPTRPVNLTATPGVESMTLAWDPPVYEGDSPITGYMVTAGVHGQYSVDAGTTTTTITGLPGGVKTLFTVVALNDVGPGDEASVVATPTSPTAPPTQPPTVPPTQPPTVPPTVPPTQPPTVPPTVEPPTDQGQAVTVRVRAVSGGKKLYVNVGPNKGKGYYQFAVQKLSKGKWRTLPKVYKTYGKGETRRLRLARGTYRVIVLPRYGLQGMTSEVISLRTGTPSVLPPETEQAVDLTTRSASKERKLYVNVDPNMGKGYFQFVVQKMSSGKWRALSKVYTTRTRVEKRTLNLRRGTYRVIVMPRYGYQGSMSDSVWLRR